MWVPQPTNPAAAAAAAAARDASRTRGSEELRPAPPRHQHTPGAARHITVSRGLSRQRAAPIPRCPWWPPVGSWSPAGTRRLSSPGPRRGGGAGWWRPGRGHPGRAEPHGPGTWRGVGEGDLKVLGTASRPAGPRGAGPRSGVAAPGCGSRVMVPGDLVRDAPSPVYRRRLERCLDRKRDDLRPVHVVHSCRLLLGGKGLGRELFRTRGMPAQPPPPAHRCPTWWLARVL